VVDGSSTELRTRGLEAVWPRVRVTSALLAFTASPRPCICTWQPYRACTVPVHAGSSFACFLFGVREKYYLKILFVSWKNTVYKPSEQGRYRARYTYRACWCSAVAAGKKKDSTTASGSNTGDALLTGWCAWILWSSSLKIMKCILKQEDVRFTATRQKWKRNHRSTKLLL